MKKILAYPATILFALVIGGLFVLDLLAPTQTFSELENRQLASAPKFTIEQLVSNLYTADYETYVNDQFVMRDSWIGMKSRAESLLGKTENNGVIFGDEDYQFAKLLEIDTAQYEKNLNAILSFASRHEGLVTAMVVPSASNVLAQYLPAGVPLADENPSLDAIAAALSPVCNYIDLRTTFAGHESDYIFYRTDHHWTTQGALLAQAAFAETRALTAFDASAHTAVTVEDFYGTNYSKSKLHSTVADEITYYEFPAAALELAGDTNPVYNLEAFATRDKYAAFIYGNNNFSTLTGGTGTGRCLLIKDSYGNCFAPLLLDTYAEIDIIDLRFFSQNMDALLAERGYDDVIILYNFSSFQSDNNLVKLNLNL